jgi:carbamoyl-phosphate synthase large subunit
MRRELRDGNTYRAYTGSYPELDRMMLEVAKRLKPYGPVNFQFRCDRAGVPKIFEINARFSGTTPLRARAGFDEVEMALRLLQLGERDFNPQIRPLVFLRHWSETIITPQQLEQIEQLDPTPLDSEPDIARVELGGSSAGLI